MAEIRGPGREVQVDVDGVQADRPPVGRLGRWRRGPTGSVRGRSNGRRLPALLRSIAGDVSLLVRQQKDIARQEVREIVGGKARGGGMLAAAAVLGLFVIGFLGLAGAEALDLVVPRWAGFLIVGGAFLLLALVMGLAGRRALRARTTPEHTKQTLKEDVEWAKQQLRR